MGHDVVPNGVPAADAAVNGASPDPGRAKANVLRVLVVDDQAVFRLGLSRILAEQGYQIVGQARNGEEALELATQLVPDVIVMDLNLGEMSGVDTTRRLAVTVPQARVLVLTVSASANDLMDAIMAGASGYLLKGSSVEAVTNAIEGAAAGEAVISPTIAVKLLDHIRGKDAETGDRSHETSRAELSDREIQILRLMANGKENKEIAQALFISPQTVKNHISNILAKLQIENRIQAAVYAVRKGIV